MAVHYHRYSGSYVARRLRPSALRGSQALLIAATTGDIAAAKARLAASVFVSMCADASAIMIPVRRKLSGKHL